MRLFCGFGHRAVHEFDKIVIVWTRSVSHDDGRLVLWGCPDDEAELKRAVVGLHGCVLRWIETLDHILVDLLDMNEEAVDEYCGRAVR